MMVAVFPVIRAGFRSMPMRVGGRRRCVFVGGQLPIAILIEFLQRCRRVRDLLSVNDIVVVDIENLHDRLWFLDDHMFLRPVNLIVVQLAILILIESQQGGRCIGHLIGINDAIIVDIQRLDDGRPPAMFTVP